MEGVNQCLAPDPVRFVSDDDVQGPRLAFDDDFEFGSGAVRKLAPNARECIGQIGVVVDPGPKAFNALPALSDGSIGTIEGVIHQLSCRLRWWDLVGDGLELQHQTTRALQQRIV